MTGPSERFLDDFERHGSTLGTWEKFVALVREHPDALPSLVEGGLRRRLSGARFLGDAVSYLPASAVAALAELAVRLHVPEQKRSTGREMRSASEEVLWRVALQFPRLLHPWLTELFEQEVGFDEYYGVHPWRESGERHHAYLLNVVRSSGSGKRAARALECLLETRTPAAFRAVERHEHLLMHGNARLRHWARIEWHLPGVGYERARGRSARAGSGWARSAAASLLARLPHPGKEPWRRLYPEASYHLGFPEDYLPQHGAGWRDHPTFHLDSEGAVPARLGGAGAAECGVCGRRAHHLLTLDPVPAGLGVTSVPALALETCLHCIWDNSELWWKHDRAGRPTPHPRQDGDPDHGMERVPLRETTVRLVPTPARWYWQDARNERENLTRLGGYPTWIQSAGYPSCPDCQKTMPFLFQLDAVCPGEGAGTFGDGGEIFDDRGEPFGGGGQTFGDGILYTYWCDACRVSVSVPQGT
ncbi:MAG TPA: hypothetical protein VF006_26545 [Longimicrobium sp.]